MLWKELFAPQSKVRLGFFGHISLALLAVTALGMCFYALFSINRMAGYFPSGHWYLMQTLPFSDLIACFGGLAISARAASSITSERERQCWDSLIVSPIEARTIVWAKILGSLYSARWLVALVATMWGLGALIDITLLPPTFISFCTLLLVLLFGCTLGVFFSAGSNSSLRSMGCTLGTLIFFGGGYLFCCMPVLMMGGGGRDGEVMLALCMPFLVVFPLITAVESSSAQHAPGYIAYFIGIISYAAATFILAAAATRRLRPNEDKSRLPPYWPGLAVPEAIDEGNV